MAFIYLTQNKRAIIDAFDWPEMIKYKWHYNNGVACRRVEGKVVLMHRVIMNTPRGMDTDHINGNRLDNRRQNLRICTTRENSQNKIGKQTSKHSIYKGVRLRKVGKYTYWAAHITHGKQQLIQNFPTELAAAMAYDIWAKDWFGEYAKLNFN